MEILERISEPTPKFWRKVRKIALILTGIGSIIATAPISLPAGIITIGGYLATAGAVGASLSQLTSTMR
ncbi:MAG: hypothetical protein EAY81_11985 [Bacteroidetes bacterium]|nr:MAG: hypothetical protein EAY81_11985 [Bacteroidota bacterium]